MCLILIAWQVSSEYPLIVAANRDEFFKRPSNPIASWHDTPYVFAGRDLEAGGTWLGITQTGRFSAVTNVRDPARAPGANSRGLLTQQFLTGNASPEDYVKAIDGNSFSGFNLLAGDNEALYYCSNYLTAPQKLSPGIYGISNHLLDTPWPKLVQAKQKFTRALTSAPQEEAFFELLADRSLVEDDKLPSTGVAIEWERTLSAIFVHTEGYGTRASTVIFKGHNKTIMIERSFDQWGISGEKKLEIPLSPSRNL